MRYVVTGAAGFIGSHLAEALANAGHDVVGVDAFAEYYDPALKEANARGLDVLRLNLAEDPLDDVLAGADGVFHLAGQPGVRASWGEDFDLYVRRNVVATQRLLEAAAPAGLRIVFASSSSVYGDAEAYPTPEEAAPAPISPYGITKLACEHLIRAYRADAVVLRYFTVYGPRQRPDMAFARLVAALSDGHEFHLHGNTTRSFTYVADAIAATLLAMEAAPAQAVLNVGGGVEATMEEAIAMLERFAGATLKVVRHPQAVGDARRTAADTSRLRALGWSPQVPLEQGLRAQWEWASARVAAR